MANEIKEKCIQITQLWRKYIEIICYFNQEISQFLQKSHIELLSTAYSCFIKNSEIIVSSFPIHQNEQAAEEQKNSVNSLRKELYNKYLKDSTVKQAFNYNRLKEYLYYLILKRFQYCSKMFSIETLKSPRKHFQKDLNLIYLFLCMGFKHGMVILA